VELMSVRPRKAQVKEALLEDRLQDAADILMQELGLNCAETSDLLDVPAC
jgi:hypothetical protein